MYIEINQFINSRELSSRDLGIHNLVQNYIDGNFEIINEITHIFDEKLITNRATNRYPYTYPTRTFASMGREVWLWWIYSSRTSSILSCKNDD